MNNGMHLDGILEAGDLGFFPDVTKLDNATKRFARSDPEELDLPIISDDRNQCATTSCSDVRSTAIRLHWKLSVATSSGVTAITKTTTRLRKSPSVSVLASRRFQPALLPAERRSYRRRRNDCRAISGAPEGDDVERSDRSVLGRNVSHRAVQRLRGKSCDILLPHCAPRGIGSESDRFGSDLLRETVQEMQPVFQLYGHHSRPIPQATIGRTQCVWLNDTNFSKTRDATYNGPLEPGCMAIIRWRSEDDNELTVINDDWFRQTTGATWRHY